MSQTTQGLPRGQRSKTSSVVVNFTATADCGGRAWSSDTAQAVLPDRLPAFLEAAVYFTCSEALANVAKHAHASAVTIEVARADRTLRVVIADDGAGGADLARGSGLQGLKDRAEALGGRLTMTSPAGAGTTIQVLIPWTSTALAVRPRGPLTTRS